MSFFRRLKTMWFTLQQVRALKAEGVTDPQELRRLLLERVTKQVSGGALDLTQTDRKTSLVKASLQRATGGAIDFGMSDPDAVPPEARDLWEEYDPDDADTEISDRHLLLIRRMRFAWNNAEAGAPRLDTEDPYGSPDPLKDIAQILGEAPVAELARRHADMTGVLNAFLQRAELAPGAYEVEGRTIDLSKDHLRLARVLRFFWDTDALEGFEEGPWPGPSADPKRPYGDFAFFQKVMALHLGWTDGRAERELTEEEISRLTAVHHEMLDVLRVMAAPARVDFGATSVRHP